MEALNDCALMNSTMLQAADSMVLIVCSAISKLISAVALCSAAVEEVEAIDCSYVGPRTHCAFRFHTHTFLVTSQSSSSVFESSMKIPSVLSTLRS